MPTEGINPATHDLDTLDLDRLVELLIEQQAQALQAALAARADIVLAVAGIVERLRRDGTLHYLGAGTSGRLAVLDAAECPPTFGTPPSLVRAHIAGGAAALTRAVEGAEDDAAEGARTIREAVRASDAVVAISASGGARFVVAGLRVAREIGAFTVALTSAPNSALARYADVAIVTPTGAEAIGGSTRLGAGTAQKIVLNTISTATMVRLGKVHDNLMVDVVATNEKLRRRAVRLVCTLAHVAESEAGELLRAADGNVKVAVVMHARHVDAAAARSLLVAHDGFLRAALD